jgi:hypothetical protein
MIVPIEVSSAQHSVATLELTMWLGDLLIVSSLSSVSAGSRRSPSSGGIPLSAGRIFYVDFRLGPDQSPLDLCGAQS